MDIGPCPSPKTEFYLRSWTSKGTTVLELDLGVAAPMRTANSLEICLTLERL